MLPKNSQQDEALGGIARVCPSCFRTYTTIELTKLLLDRKEGLNCYSKRGCEGPYIRSDTLVKPGVVSDGLAIDSFSFQALDGVYVNGSFFTGGNPLAPFDSPMLSAFNTTFVKVKPTTLGMPFMLNGIWLRMNWNSKHRGEISALLDMARGAAGSHTLIAWSSESNTDQGTYFSMMLMKDGAVIFRTQTNGANVTDCERNGSTGLRSDRRVHLILVRRENLLIRGLRVTGCG